MKHRVRLSEAAQRDVHEAKEWYVENGARGLDLRFQHELEYVLQQIEAFPSSFQIIHRDVRKVNLRRFPYAVFFPEDTAYHRST